MRYLVALMTLFLCASVLADEIKCYNYGRVIYARHGKDFIYSEGVISFREATTDKYVFITSDCIVKIEA
jgi:hypothetical protein